MEIRKGTFLRCEEKKNYEKIASLWGLEYAEIIKRVTNGSRLSMGWVVIHKAIAKMTCQGSLSIHVLFLVPYRDNCSRRRLIRELREIQRLLSLPIHVRRIRHGTLIFDHFLFGI